MQLNDWVNGLLGGTALEAARLNYRDELLHISLMQLARDPSQLFAGAVTLNDEGAPISAVVEWPDGKPGNYSGTASIDFPSALDAYTMTHISDAGTVTFTQPPVTRDSVGHVINRPPITIT